MALESRVGESELILLGLIPFRDGLLTARSSVSSSKPAELPIRATRFVADCCGESKALTIAPWDCPVTAALSAELKPGLFRML